MAKEKEPKNLVGIRFGRLVGLYRLVSPAITWRCRCDCGAELSVTKTHLVSGLVKSCGCLRKENGTLLGLKNLQSLVGQKFNLLTVIAQEGYARSEALWRVMCACGKTDTATSNQLHKGKKTRCGNCARDYARERSTKHGATTWKGPKPPLYNVWVAMRSRCNNPNNPGYPNYGGRGISVDPRWDSYANFVLDMGLPPSTGHSLERKDNGGDYSPENCVWATRIEQANNRRNNRQVAYEGETLTLTQLSIKCGIDYRLLQHRLRRGWSVARAITPASATSSR